VRQNVLPVRVRQGGTWGPVSTSLRRSASGALATISAGDSKLSLSWPGQLPTPTVSGSSATYKNVLPGVDLVLTATSETTGGVSEIPLSIMLR